MLNNIKSKYILYQIFKLVKNRTKINIIKYNKKLINKLDITKKDFEIYESLKEFNKINNCNLRDIDDEELDLNTKNIGNENLKYLNIIELNQLKKLILRDNNISDIKLLESNKFINLEILDLSKNKILNIRNTEII